MKLLLMPLGILLIISLLAMMGLGSASQFGTQNLYDPSNSGAGYYDSTGHMVAYSNYTAVNAAEGGTLRFAGGPFSQTNHDPHWEYTNTTASYEVFNTPNGANVVPFGSEFNLTSNLGIMGIVAVIMALATIVGVRIMGTGVAEESVSAIIKGSALVTLWLIFSSLSIGLITSMAPAGLPIGPIFYFGLTLVYTLGIINQIGHPGDD